MNDILGRILKKLRRKEDKMEEEIIPEGSVQCFYCKEWKPKDKINYCLSCRQTVCDKCLPFHEES